MYIKEDNIFIELEDCFLMKVQYKKIWYNVYIDKDDLYRVKEHHWRTSHKKNKIYIVTGSKSKNNIMYLHNFIMNHTYIVGYEIDHLDGNSLNNRKNNLKKVTRQENIENSNVRIDNKIGIRGICKNPWNSYKVDFSYRGNRYYFPNFKTIEEAVYCRKFAEEYFGLDMLNRNPLSKQYLTLDDEQQENIKNIIIEILRK